MWGDSQNNFGGGEGGEKGLYTCKLLGGQEESLE